MTWNFSLLTSKTLKRFKKVDWHYKYVYRPRRVNSPCKNCKGETRSCFNKIGKRWRGNLGSFRGDSGGIGSIRMQWGERVSHAEPSKLLTSSPSSRILIDSSYQRDLFQRILTFAISWKVSHPYIYIRVDPRLDSWNGGNLVDTILSIFDPDRKKTGFRAGIPGIEANRGNCFR